MKHCSSTAHRSLYKHTKYCITSPTCVRVLHCCTRKAKACLMVRYLEMQFNNVWRKVYLVLDETLCTYIYLHDIKISCYIYT